MPQRAYVPPSFGCQDCVCSPAAAGLLAPFTRLRSLQLVWYCSADWPQLPPSVRSVTLQLPGNAYAAGQLAHAEGAAAQEVVQQLNAQYAALGWISPLPEVRGA